MVDDGIARQDALYGARIDSNTALTSGGGLYIAGAAQLDSVSVSSNVVGTSTAT